ncbi:MAG TPA: hypothetical protein VI197_02435 [Polyangiaceae bacterium]
MGRRSGERGSFVELEELVLLRDADGAPAGGTPRSRQAASGQFRRTRVTEANQRTVLLVVDQRLCMFFGSAAVTKSAFAARVAALVAWRTVIQGGRVGALIAGEHRHWSLPPAASSAEVMGLLEQLVEAGRTLDGCRPASGDPFRAALDAVAEQRHERALVLIISDLRGFSEHAVSTLGRLRQHNDLLLGWVIDPLEIALPDAPPPLSEGLGDGSWPASDAALRNALTTAFEQERARVRQLSLKLAAPYRQLRTDRPLLEQLRSSQEFTSVSVGRAG